MTGNSPETALWPAPTAPGPVAATVTVPGSKSVTNRALVLAALASEPGWLRRPLRSRDTLLMADALRALGVGIEEQVGSGGGEVWRVIPAGLHGPARVDVGNAGTVMRFLPPVAALADGPVRFDGDPRSHERPLHGVIDALRALGARIDDDGRGALPMTVHGSGSLAGGRVRIDASSSSQLRRKPLHPIMMLETVVRLRYKSSLVNIIESARNFSSLTTSLSRKLSSSLTTCSNSDWPGMNHLMSRLERSEDCPQSSSGEEEGEETILELSARQMWERE